MLRINKHHSNPGKVAAICGRRCCTNQTAVLDCGETTVGLQHQQATPVVLSLVPAGRFFELHRGWDVRLKQQANLYCSGWLHYSTQWRPLLCPNIVRRSHTELSHLLYVPLNRPVEYSP